MHSEMSDVDRGSLLSLLGSEELFKSVNVNQLGIQPQVSCIWGMRSYLDLSCRWKVKTSYDIVKLCRAFHVEQAVLP
jgi:hypothetical protein